MKKVAARCCFLLFFACLLTLPVSAKDDADMAVETGEIAGELADFQAAVPPEVAELLPADFFSQDPIAMGESVREASGFSAVLSVIAKLTGLSIRENLALLAKICGLLLLGAIFRALATGGETSPALGQAISLCTALSLTALLIALQIDRFREITRYFEVMQGVSTALIPLMGALYAMGGNVGVAVANHGIMAAFLTILQTLCSGTVMPVASLCLCLALLETVSGNLSLRSLGTLIKRTCKRGSFAAS